MASKKTLPLYAPVGKRKTLRGQVTSRMDQQIKKLAAVPKAGGVIKKDGPAVGGRVSGPTRRGPDPSLSRPAGATTSGNSNKARKSKVLNAVAKAQKAPGTTYSYKTAARLAREARKKGWLK